MDRSKDLLNADAHIGVLFIITGSWTPPPRPGEGISRITNGAPYYGAASLSARGLVATSAAEAPGMVLTRPSVPTPVHSYESMLPEMERVMEFYETARVDGLVKREETPKTMTEYYQGRADFLSYRHINFGSRVKKLGTNSSESNPRPIVVRARWA